MSTSYEGGILDLEFTQSSRDNGEGPLHVPFAFGLLDEEGRELVGKASRDRHLKAEVSTTAHVKNRSGDGTLVLHLTEDVTSLKIRVSRTCVWGQALSSPPSFS